MDGKADGKAVVHDDPEDDPLFGQAVARNHVANILQALRHANKLQEKEINALSRFIMMEDRVLGEFQDLVYQKMNDAGLSNWVVSKLEDLQLPQDRAAQHSTETKGLKQSSSGASLSALEQKASPVKRLAETKSAGS